jgi:mannose-6-phosphate isomerase class I
VIAVNAATEQTAQKRANKKGHRDERWPFPNDSNSQSLLFAINFFAALMALLRLQRQRSDGTRI